MDVDRECYDDASNHTIKGTKGASLYDIFWKGARRMKLQGSKANGGGSMTRKSTLKTTMKRTSSSRKKLGFYATKGAKSRSQDKKLTRESRNDSSQLEITNYFSKKGGLIGSGNEKKLGDIPQGDVQKPI